MKAIDFFSNLKLLSELRDCDAQDSIEQLVKICGAIPEEKALLVWLTRENPSFLSEVTVATPGSPLEDKPVKLTIEQNVDDISILVEEDGRAELISLNRTRGESPRAPGIHLSSLERALREEMLTPKEAQLSLSSLSSIPITGQETKAERVTLNGTRYLCKVYLEAINKQLTDFGQWSLPNDREREIRSDLSVLLEDYPCYLRIQGLKGQESELRRSIISVCEVSLGLLKLVKDKLSGAQDLTSKVPQALLTEGLEGTSITKRVILTPLHEGSVLAPEHLLNIATEQVAGLKVSSMADGKSRIEIYGPDDRLLEDILEPLREDFHFEIVP